METRASAKSAPVKDREPSRDPATAESVEMTEANRKVESGSNRVIWLTFLLVLAAGGAAAYYLL